MDDSEGLAPGLPRSLHRVLRHVVAEHARTCRGARLAAPHLHVGLPGAAQRSHLVSGSETDHTLRTDIITAMVAQVAPRTRPWTPLVWLTRRGPLAPSEDVDLAWLASARSAFDELGLRLIFITVDRHGWRDPRSGVERHWVRLRPD